MALMAIACGSNPPKGGNQNVKSKSEKVEQREERNSNSVTLPDFTQNDISGQPVSLHAAISQNKVTLIDFWASWCGPCRAEMPNVVSLYETYKDKGFGIIGISLDEDADSWKNAVQAMNMNWLQLSDLNGWNNEISASLGIRSIPFTIIVDSKARVLAAGLRGEELERKIEELL